jgi:hypothetical protein
MDKVSLAFIILSLVMFLWGMISANVYADDSGVDYSFGTGAIKGSSGWAIFMVFGSAIVGGITLGVQ